MRIEVHSRIDVIDPNAWNAMVPDNHPFLLYEFLQALEHHESVGQKWGWLPQYIVAYRDQSIIGASPLYLKFNSYGEFVFDWAWAEAYQRNGLPYYPKLVSAIPYTPATGRRLLVAPGEVQHEIEAELINATLDLAKAHQVSSIHWLFPTAEEHQHLTQMGLLERLDCQYHWHNQGYQNFEHYLSFLTARKRKKIARERRYVQEQNIRIQVYHGDEMTPQQWQRWHEFYINTFEKKSGIPTFSERFFMDIGARLKQQVIVIFAYQQEQSIAAALCFKSDTTLYGRHWGCETDANYHSLHFELCYYQGLDYCIEHQLSCFEPGAQGEHKISRGFLPVPTRSAHWIAHPQFAEAIAHYVEEEKTLMQRRIETLKATSPFREA